MSTSESRSAEPLFEPLTRREREILGLLADGHSAPEIAQQLHLALSSVKWYFRQVYGKLGVNSKKSAVLRARELGLLQPIPPVSAPERVPVASAPSRRRHNLPQQLTNFIGRAHQIAEAERLLQVARLLTLTGPGGTGKTRLALQIGLESLEDFPDGVWFIELAPIAEPAQVALAVAQALVSPTNPAESFGASTADASESDHLSTITAHVADKHLLVILDNCEHLVDACAQLAEHLLRAAPALRILATSREAFGVTGETSYAVPPLTVPASDELPSLPALAQFEAVQLLAERAAAVRPDFALTETNARAVAHVCQRLEGIPLAIELAAARTRSLSIEQIAAHLDNRFRLLTGGSRTASPRQQTLRGAIDWSYDLLTHEERSLLRSLSVFTGGWTLEAAEHMLAGPQTLDLLNQLVLKSLVLSEQAPGQAARFRMLETIREYALEKLAQTGDEATARDQHLVYYVALAEAAEPELRGASQGQWLRVLDSENDNLRAALAWAAKQATAEPALRLAGALTRFWTIRQNADEGHRWLEAALQMQPSPAPPSPDPFRAKALLAAGWMGAWLAGGGAGQFDAPILLSDRVARFQQALSMYRDLGDKAGEADALYWLAKHRVAANQDHAGALDLYQAAFEFWLTANDGWSMGICLHWMGHAVEHMGDGVRALDYYQRSVALLRESGDQWELSWPLLHLVRQARADGDVDRSRSLEAERNAYLLDLGDTDALVGHLSDQAWLAAAQGDYARAREIALSMPKRTPDQLNATALARLGEVEYLQGHLDEARQFFEAGFDIWGQDKDLNGQAWPLARLGAIAYRLGDVNRATEFLKQSHEFLGPTGWWSYNLALVYLLQADVARVQGDLEVSAGLYQHSIKTLLQDNALIDLPDRLEGLAKLALAMAKPKRAARLFGASKALRERISVPIPAVEHGAYDEAVAAARAQLDPELFVAAWAEGQALSLEQATEYALADPSDDN